MDTEIAHRATILEALPDRPEPSGVPDPWDVGSARLCERLGHEFVPVTSIVGAEPT